MPSELSRTLMKATSFRRVLGPPPADGCPPPTALNRRLNHRNWTSLLRPFVEDGYRCIGAGQARELVFPF